VSKKVAGRRRRTQPPCCPCSYLMRGGLEGGEKNTIWRRLFTTPRHHEHVEPRTLWNRVGPCELRTTAAHGRCPRYGEGDFFAILSAVFRLANWITQSVVPMRTFQWLSSRGIGKTILRQAFREHSVLVFPIISKSMVVLAPRLALEADRQRPYYQNKKSRDSRRGPSPDKQHTRVRLGP